MSTLVEAPTGADVAAYIGRNDSAFIAGRGAIVAGLALEAAASYTRKEWPEGQCPKSIRWAILTRAVRMATNQEQLLSQSMDTLVTEYGDAGQGWTLAELKALNDYRRMAA